MKKIGDSFKGIIVGFILIIAGIGVLWWNEGNNVKNLKTTAELEKTFIDVKSDKVDSKNEGKLIATSGKLINEEELTDKEFGVTVLTPVLTRVVEVYQWEEDSDTTDGETTYRYEKTWSDTIIDSSNFHDSSYQNPTSKKFEDKLYTASDVKVGAFSLTDAQIKKLSTDGKFNDYNKEVIDELGLTISGYYVTDSNDLDKPEVGDTRVSFQYNDSKEVSVLAVQSGDSFTSFTSSAGKTINRVMDGTHTGKEMIETIKSENKFLKWILRLVGFLLITFGFAAILGPISTIASFVPIVGGLVGAAVAFVSFALGLALSFIIIAIAWIRFRPVLGISLLAGAAVLIVLLVMNGKKKKENNPQPTTENAE